MASVPPFLYHMLLVYVVVGVPILPLVPPSGVRDPLVEIRNLRVQASLPGITHFVPGASLRDV